MHLSTSKLEIFASNWTNANNDVKYIIIPCESASIKMHKPPSQNLIILLTNFQMNDSYSIKNHDQVTFCVARMW